MATAPAVPSLPGKTPGERLARTSLVLGHVTLGIYLLHLLAAAALTAFHASLIRPPPDADEIVHLLSGYISLVGVWSCGLPMLIRWTTCLIGLVQGIRAMVKTRQEGANGRAQEDALIGILLAAGGILLGLLIDPNIMSDLPRMLYRD